MTNNLELIAKKLAFVLSTSEADVIVKTAGHSDIHNGNRYTENMTLLVKNNDAAIAAIVYVYHSPTVDTPIWFLDTSLGTAGAIDIASGVTTKLIFRIDSTKGLATKITAKSASATPNIDVYLLEKSRV